jgi:hypothetical protein
MTREEQKRLYLKERNIPITSLEANSIIEGIDWADEHPNLKSKELLYTVQKTAKKTKKKIISKACEWLEEQNKMCMYELEMILGGKFINDFKKAMEK